LKIQNNKYQIPIVDPIMRDEDWNLNIGIYPDEKESRQILLFGFWNLEFICTLLYNKYLKRIINVNLKKS